ncbi:hypothetical protein D3C84_1302090 [compost metagenome]
MSTIKFLEAGAGVVTFDGVAVSAADTVPAKLRANKETAILEPKICFNLFFNAIPSYNRISPY